MCVLQVSNSIHKPWRRACAACYCGRVCALRIDCAVDVAQITCHIFHALLENCHAPQYLATRQHNSHHLTLRSSLHDSFLFAIDVTAFWRKQTRHVKLLVYNRDNNWIVTVAHACTIWNIERVQPHVPAHFYVFQRPIKSVVGYTNKTKFARDWNLCQA